MMQEDNHNTTNQKKALLRTDSFPSLSGEDNDNDNDDDEEPNSLEEENDRLRQELHRYKVKVALLQGKLKKKKYVSLPSKKSKQTLLLELPGTLRLKAQQAKCCNGGGSGNGSKDHQSLSTDDGQDTIEPNAVERLGSHESAAGLHHRGTGSAYQQKKQYSPSKAKTTKAKATSTPTASNTTPKRSSTTTTCNDDSLSSTDDTLEEEGLELESQELLLSSRSQNNQHNTNAAVNDDDNDDDNFYVILSDRAGWLVGLLVLQSMSSFILARNEALLERHMVIIQFLTMLVGAGGNAGNQASVRVIRGLAVGSINTANTRQFLRHEFKMGLCLSLILGTAGCIRAAVFMIPWLETFAITASLYMIVIISIVLGALLPLGMRKVGIDPAHSSTTIQVIMDILGVSITVLVSSLVLDSNFQDWITTTFAFMGDA